MSTIGSLTLCIQNLRSPDVRARDEAARIIWDRFAARLQALARRHLDNRIRRREDEHDILQSMYASFCVGQREGNASPASREELWRLLVRITLCKVVNTANRNYAARRDVRRESSPNPSLFPLWMLDHVDRAQVDPEERLIVLEELDRLLQELPEKLRQIVVWKVEGFTNAEIARQLNCTVRSIELKMQLTRKRLGTLARPGRPDSEADRHD
ncbi:MAG: RNA polymerase sigma factor [Isosphaeraceae bacterium]